MAIRAVRVSITHANFWVTVSPNYVYYDALSSPFERRVKADEIDKFMRWHWDSFSINKANFEVMKEISKAIVKILRKQGVKK